MGEILVVREEHLAEVIRVIRAGILAIDMEDRSPLSDKTCRWLEMWCDSVSKPRGSSR